MPRHHITQIRSRCVTSECLFTPPNPIYSHHILTLAPLRYQVSSLQHPGGIPADIPGHGARVRDARGGHGPGLHGATSAARDGRTDSGGRKTGAREERRATARAECGRPVGWRELRGGDQRSRGARRRRRRSPAHAPPPTPSATPHTHGGVGGEPLTRALDSHVNRWRDGVWRPPTWQVPGKYLPMQRAPPSPAHTRERA